MDWSKTKTIFIVVFLILNIFLLTIFIKKISEPEVLSDSSTRQSLESVNITYPADLTATKEAVNETDISAISKKFTDADKGSLKNQEVSILNENTLYSTLDEPYNLGDKLTEEDVKEKLKSFLNEYTIDGDKYAFRNLDKENLTISYNQLYKGRPIFHNGSAEIVLELNNELEIVSYKQTMMEDIKAFGKASRIITPLESLQILADSGKIEPDSKVTIFEEGYSTEVPFPDSQVLTPTWHFVIEKKEKEQHLYFTAIDGNVIEFTKKEKELLE
ncbi:two-component system regulatory protein YycI [[Bacillus] enclensis]|uniref:two-component system regulatory protein YycI n=1 Tax=[Bacillus] enclensis TaxID=1402860 RepID=UPI000509A260|nr:two-component system regulatory protein YycI [[Bacillus] enclensis]MBH9968029.1 two-component system regulatory protein YycI [[Bacillus] enclensis]